MGKKHKGKEKEQGDEDEDSEVEVVEAEGQEFALPMSDDAVVGVSFGDPDDDQMDSQRVIDWVSSFRPGHYHKQVADLFLAEGEIYVVMDKMSLTIPLMEVFRLLEKGGFFQSEK